MRTATALCLLSLLGAMVPAVAGERPVWPAAPDPTRVEYIGELRLRDLAPRQGLVGRVARGLAGKTRSESLALPFDVLRAGDRIFLTCQNVPALVEVFPRERTFRLHTCDSRPLQYPVGLCRVGDDVLVTDSRQGVVYRLRGGRLTPFIARGLERPTGIAAVGGRIYVVDTARHVVQVYDEAGRPAASIAGAGDRNFHYPTFAAAAEGEVLINDSLNYRICRFAADGTPVGAFGREGDGPGSFARPKDLAVDRDRHIYVVDNLFDNVQVFDPDGRLLLVIGGQGNGAGEFWSPGGIDIAGDTLYVADTFNHRIQLLRYLGDF